MSIQNLLLIQFIEAISICMVHAVVLKYIYLHDNYYSTMHANTTKITMRAWYVTLAGDSGSAPLTEPSIVTISSIARRTDASVSIAIWSTP